MTVAFGLNSQGYRHFGGPRRPPVTDWGTSLGARTHTYAAVTGAATVTDWGSPAGRSSPTQLTLGEGIERSGSGSASATPRTRRGAYAGHVPANTGGPPPESPRRPAKFEEPHWLRGGNNCRAGYRAIDLT